MALQNEMTTALLTEHFRYTPLVRVTAEFAIQVLTRPQTLLDDIINTVNELVFWAVDRLESALSDASPELLGFANPDQENEAEGSETALAQTKQNEIDAGIVQLESLLNATVDKDFDKVELYTLRNILTVGNDEDVELARYVQLDHYRDLKVDEPVQGVTPEELQLLRRKVHETHKLHSMLKEEETRNAAVIEQLQNILSSGEGSSEQSGFGFLVAAQREAREKNQPVVSEHVRQVVAQLPTIRQYLAQLKASLQTFRTARVTSTGNSTLAQRRQYLDSQAAEALARHGVRVSNNGQSVVNGRKIGKNDVDGIEATLQAIQGYSHDGNG